MSYENDNRTVLTLDAGGTNFVFCAIQGNREITAPITFTSAGHDLKKCLDNLVTGFKQVRDSLDLKPVAISFAFPGPADYYNGIIGIQKNLTGFNKDVALGPMLKEIFNLPVFINNDGNLFALGESVAGFLPFVNNLLVGRGSEKRFKNLLAVTLGTGFGGGIIINGNMLTGDNSAAGEIWAIRQKLERDNFAEDGASIRAVKRYFSQLTGLAIDRCPEPDELYMIGIGQLPGDQAAARETFRKMGENIGDALANAVTLVDGLIVIGGGLSGAWKLFLPEAVREMNSTMGNGIPRLEVKTYSLEDPDQLEVFLRGDLVEIAVPRFNKTVKYDSIPRIGVGISKLGTTSAVSIGAYTFALNELDSRR